jgi:hypothetical protein
MPFPMRRVLLLSRRMVERADSSTIVYGYECCFWVEFRKRRWLLERDRARCERSPLLDAGCTLRCLGPRVSIAGSFAIIDSTMRHRAHAALRLLTLLKTPNETSPASVMPTDKPTRPEIGGYELCTFVLREYIEQRCSSSPKLTGHSIRRLGRYECSKNVTSSPITADRVPDGLKTLLWLNRSSSFRRTDSGAPTTLPFSNLYAAGWIRIGISECTAEK